jgi:Holliday junction DNA helicase RuvA
MIGQLKGIIDRIENDHAIIDVNGVGYVVYASAKTRDRIGEVGTATKILIETHVREDQITLFGFTHAEEKRWFKLLQNVQGVGAKVTLAILSAFEPAEITNIILAQDKAAFKPVAGIGPKLAERLLVELKSKVNFADVPEILPSKDGAKTLAGAADDKPRNEAISALTNLGIARMDAFLAVNKVANENMKVEEIITLALKEVSK